MAGRGRWMDNVFVERLWRTVKHEDVYLRCYESPRPKKALAGPKAEKPLNLNTAFRWPLTWGPPHTMYRDRDYSTCISA